MEIIEQTHGPDILEGHLGGCSIGGDGGTYYPIMWKNLVETFKIKSVLDIGCGRGFSTKFFKDLECEVVGIDGAQQAGQMSLVPENFLLNDYEKGQAFSDDCVYNGKTGKEINFDLCWCCEFVEHVWEHFSDNFINDFKKCNYVAMTFAAIGQGGHHHVNENTEEYWIEKLTKAGFEYLPDETRILRSWAKQDKEERQKIPNVPFFISHFVDRGLFFKRV